VEKWKKITTSKENNIAKEKEQPKTHKKHKKPEKYHKIQDERPEEPIWTRSNARKD